MPTRTLLPNWASTALVVVVTLGVSTVIWNLVQQNRDLREALVSNQSQSGPAAVPTGSQLPSVEVANVDGIRESLSTLLDGKATLLFFFTTTCKYCEATIQRWTSLAEDAGLPAMGVALDAKVATDNYATAHELQYPVWTVANIDGRRSLGVATVPQTVLVSSDGVVLAAWVGALSTTAATEIATEAKSLAAFGRCCDSGE